MTALSARLWVVPFLVCPECRGALQFLDDDVDNGLLRHADQSCAETYPVIDGVPRLLRGPHRAEVVARNLGWFDASDERRALASRWRQTSRHDQVVRDFDYEWSRYSEIGTRDLREQFKHYFDIVPEQLFAPNLTVLDVGCGAGRWAFEAIGRGPRVIALDLGFSVEVARRNVKSPRAAFIQADLLDMPIASGSVDWAYSLGVLHHTSSPPEGIRCVTATLRPGGRVLLYLYYALDNRGRLFRGLFRVVDAFRRGLSVLPRPLVHTIALLLAAVVYWPLSRLSALLWTLGLRKASEQLPLSAYRRRTFSAMQNDSLDRFGTRVERRYTRQEMTDLMEASGLSDVVFSPNPPYWHAVGVRHGEPREGGMPISPRPVLEPTDH